MKAPDVADSGDSNHSDKPAERPSTASEATRPQIKNSASSRSVEALGNVSNGVSVSNPASRAGSRRPSRASSPARNLRSRPSVALSAYEATYCSNTSADSAAVTTVEEDAALLYDALSVLESNDRELEVPLPVSCQTLVTATLPG